MKHRDKHDRTDTSQYSVYKDKKKDSLYTYFQSLSWLHQPAHTPKLTQEVPRLTVQSGK